MQKLNENQLQEALANLPKWKLEDGRIARTWTFPDFLAAMTFVNKVAVKAESAGHHPDIDIRYNRVQLALVTHDASGITAKDVEMAATLDGI
jgi:4a-hydroxytetrahydrobiopterin dehydratase